MSLPSGGGREWQWERGYTSASSGKAELCLQGNQHGGVFCDNKASPETCLKRKRCKDMNDSWRGEKGRKPGRGFWTLLWGETRRKNLRICGGFFIFCSFVESRGSVSGEWKADRRLVLQLHPPPPPQLSVWSLSDCRLVKLNMFACLFELTSPVLFTPFFFCVSLLANAATDTFEYWSRRTWSHWSHSCMLMMEGFHRTTIGSLCLRCAIRPISYVRFGSGCGKGCKLWERDSTKPGIVFVWRMRVVTTRFTAGSQFAERRKNHYKEMTNVQLVQTNTTMASWLLVEGISCVLF